MILRELRAVTRKIEELLRMYRAGELERGPDTGDFIDASILQQAELLAHMRTRFPQWLAEEQARFDACIAWVAAANNHLPRGRGMAAIPSSKFSQISLGALSIRFELPTHGMSSQHRPRLGPKTMAITAS